MDAIVNNTLHYLGFAFLFAALAVELALFRPQVTGRTAARLARIDGLYGLAALVVLVTGLLRVFLYGKTPGYYGQNFVFHIKATLFVIILVLSIAPTIRFFRARRAAPEATVDYPASTGVLLRIEMGLLVVMPLLGVLMAHGYGYSG
jgi:putative membrane protein